MLGILVKCHEDLIVHNAEEAGQQRKQQQRILPHGYSQDGILLMDDKDSIDCWRLSVEEEMDMPFDTHKQAAEPAASGTLAAGSPIGQPKF